MRRVRAENINGTKRYFCEICGRAFRSKGTVKNHLILFHWEIPATSLSYKEVIINPSRRDNHETILLY